MGTWPQGIDVYNGDGDINWAAVAASGRTFAFAKSTEGMTLNDGRFAANWAGMKAAKLYRGAYHFARANYGSDGSVISHAEAQAAKFFSVVGPLTYGDLAPVLDFETAPAEMPAADVLDWIRAFLLRARSLFARNLILYVGRYWRNNLGDPLLAEANNCPLWTARYSETEPIIPRQWSKWSIWQHTDGSSGPGAGPVPGVPSPPDQDVFNGTLDDLRELAGIPRWPGRLFIHPSTPPIVGDDVRLWQARMLELNYRITVDGYYGPASQNVCRQFQTANRLVVDGVVGPQTWVQSFQ